MNLPPTDGRSQKLRLYRHSSRRSLYLSREASAGPDMFAGAGFAWGLLRRKAGRRQVSRVNFLEDYMEHATQIAVWAGRSWLTIPSPPFKALPHRLPGVDAFSTRTHPGAGHQAPFFGIRFLGRIDYVTLTGARGQLF